MFIDRFFNQGPTPVLESELAFTEARQQVIAENVANKDVPNYQQKDLSVEKFQQMMRDKVEQQNTAAPGSVQFGDIETEIENPASGILFHDGNNVSMEQMMSENSKNFLMHSLVVELLRRQYQTMDMALKERVS